MRKRTECLEQLGTLFKVKKYAVAMGITAQAHGNDRDGGPKMPEKTRTHPTSWGAQGV